MKYTDTEYIEDRRYSDNITAILPPTYCNNKNIYNYTIIMIDVLY